MSRGGQSSACGLVFLLWAQASCAQVDSAPDVSLTWVEKYLTYRQDAEDLLTLTDAHFLAEITFDGERDFDGIHA